LASAWPSLLFGPQDFLSFQESENTDLLNFIKNRVILKIPGHYIERMTAVDVRVALNGLARLSGKTGTFLARCR
jgi:hypothetical protein